jgi:hypothetical protein
VPDARKDLNLQPGKTGVVTWTASVVSRDIPWVLVVVPDDDLAERKELTP